MVGHDAAVVIFALLGLAAFAVLALLGLRRRTLWAVLATVVVMGAVVFALSVWPKPFPDGIPAPPVGPDPAGPLLAEVVRSSTDPYLGRLALVREWRRILDHVAPLERGAEGR